MIPSLCAPQGIRHFPGDLERVVERELPLPGEPLAQRFALYKRHCIPELPGPFTGIEDGQDMRMLQAGGHLDLALEPLRTQGGGELRMEDLQGDQAIVLEVSCAVDRRHPPAAELTLDRVTAGEGGLQMSEEISQAVARGAWTGAS